MRPGDGRTPLRLTLLGSLPALAALAVVAATGAVRPLVLAAGYVLAVAVAAGLGYLRLAELGRFAAWLEGLAAGRAASEPAGLLADGAGPAGAR